MMGSVLRSICFVRSSLAVHVSPRLVDLKNLFAPV